MPTETPTPETKEQYTYRMRQLLTPEMRPFIDDLTVPCSCGLEVCRGWRIKTMLREELPPEARARVPKSLEKKAA